MTVETTSAIRDPRVLRVRVVDELPAACGGGVAVREPDGMIWVLIEPNPPEETPPPGYVDMPVFTAFGYRLLEAGEPLTVADHSAEFDLPLEVAQAAWWEIVWEWWDWAHREEPSYLRLG